MTGLHPLQPHGQLGYTLLLTMDGWIDRLFIDGLMDC